MSRVHVIVTVTSPLAFVKLGKSSVVATAVERAKLAKCAPSVSVWIDENLADAWQRLSTSQRPGCIASTGTSLLDAVREQSAELILVHDAQRPLTLPSTFDRVVEALDSGIDAARPSHVVVDTLKTIDEQSRITGTINRDLVQSLTSPEGFKASAIDFSGRSIDWSVPLKAESRTHFVVGDQESLRIRETEDVLLVESFLAWQTFTNSPQK